MFLVCGEALFDLFLQSEEGPASATYAARAGGSPFNVAIGLARLGENAGLLTGLSSDLLGQRLSAVLAAEGVSTAYAIPTDRPTTISLVGLDTAGVPAYQFYKNGSADTGVVPGDLPTLGSEVTGLHFGSYSLAAAPVADAFAALAERHRERFVSIDPNVRPTVEPDMDVWRERLGRLYPLATIVKISAEDLELLHPGTAAETFAGDLLAKGVSLVVVTDGGDAAKGWTAGGAHAAATPPRVKIVDTVGAGDTFQAALIARLHRAGGGPKARVAALDANDLALLLAYAARAASITCSRQGADLPRLAELSD
jgi:fructokinase